MRHLQRSPDEQGFALVSAIVLMALMLGIGHRRAAGMPTTTPSRTREQRVRESALATRRGRALRPEPRDGHQVAHARSIRYPASCTSPAQSATSARRAATLGGDRRPAPTSPTSIRSNSAWKTKVRDNGGALAERLRPAEGRLAQTTTGLGTCAAPCTYDFNQRPRDLGPVAVDGPRQDAQRRGAPAARAGRRERPADRRHRRRARP